jgi:hypothetical protein
MTNTQPAISVQRRKALAAPAGRVSQYPRKRENVMTKIDALIEVAKKLKEARAVGEACSDRALLYFIDMTIVHVCDSLGSRQQPEDAADSDLNLAHASL